jgi:hypothetical protein
MDYSGGGYSGSYDPKLNRINKAIFQYYTIIYAGFSV